MANFDVKEIKAYIPAKDFSLSIEFYKEIGFDLEWSTNDLAYFRAGSAAFMLQNFYIEEHAKNFQMHILVASADDWYQRIQSKGISKKYSVNIGKPTNQDWGVRDFSVMDPSGVLWRIGNELS